MFASRDFFYVPAERQVSVYFSEHNARHNNDPVATFTQLENTTTDHTIVVNGQTVRLELEEFKGTAPVEFVEEWMTAMRTNLAPYMNNGVIVESRKPGEITTRFDNGVWLMSRGLETLTLNNRKHLPAETSDYWVAYTSYCNNCKGTPDFEFVGIDSSTLIIPEGTTLGEHLRPFVQCMEDEQHRMRANVHEHHPLVGLFKGLRLPGMTEDDIDVDQKHTSVLIDVIAGVGQVYTGRNVGEIGGVAIDGTPVLTLIKDGAVILGKTVNGDENDAYDTDRKLISALVGRINDIQRIPLTSITPQQFSASFMAVNILNAMRNEYQATDELTHQLFSGAQTSAVQKGPNWWLRTLINAWFMHTGYPCELVLNAMSYQLNELGDHLNVDDADVATVRVALRNVVTDWYKA